VPGSTALLLVLGGRIWLERRFRAVLDRLAEAYRSERDGGGGPLASPHPHTSATALHPSEQG
jgi:hypothetical protein